MSEPAYTIQISGASDDLIEVEGAPLRGCDEYNAERAMFLVRGTDARSVLVRMAYGNSGVWEATIRPEAEDHPTLPVVVEGHRYTAVVCIDDVTSVDRIVDREGTP